MDILKLTRSVTRQKILKVILSDPEKPFYLRQIERILKLSVGNIRRELLALKAIKLLKTQKIGRLVYYKINNRSPLLNMLKNSYSGKKIIDIEKKGLDWVSSVHASNPETSIYCQTRDIFSARLEGTFAKLEKAVNKDAYLLTAVIGEIGNNSFDHNLGNWPDNPGIFFAFDIPSKKIVLADRGLGILKTIRRVIPDLSSHRQALQIAFTKNISGRFPEQRGNGLKFVSRVIRENNWELKFLTGNAQIIISGGKITASISSVIKGCLAVIKY